MEREEMPDVRELLNWEEKNIPRSNSCKKMPGKFKWETKQVLIERICSYWTICQEGWQNLGQGPDCISNQSISDAL